MNNKKKFITIVFSICLMLLVVGFSYAFFIYNKTGLYTHTITGGKMKVIYDELAGNNITIENTYPLTDKEAETKSLEFEFKITGYNESEKNIYYAIEIDHGEDVTGKNRFLDTDMKISLYENDNIVIENEIYRNLDNQDIYYGYISYGTNENNPTISNYRMRIWINDNVYISDTIENDIDSWNEMDYNWANNSLDYDELERIDNKEVTTLSELGISVYISEEFANSYVNFKVNVRADLTYDDVGYLTYDANGGEYTPKKSSLTTNMITQAKPTMENMGFLGWSTDPNATVPEYKAGDVYTGNGKILYAVYGDTRNVMDSFPEEITNQREYITEVHFINDTEENIDVRYNAVPIKVDLTHNNQGRVLGWLENDYYDEENSQQYYKLYVGSEGTTYLNTGKELFYSWENLILINFENVDTSLVTDMSSMFYFVEKIDELDLSSFNTSNVTNMSQMFYYTEKINELDLNDFNTSNVTDMSSMFEGVTVEELDLSNFDTSEVRDMREMFDYCLSKKIDISSFDTSNVTNMWWMFTGVEVEELDLSNFNTSKVTTMEGMFCWCLSKKIDVSSFDTSNVTDMRWMFEEIYLDKLDLSNFDTTSLEDVTAMFYFSEIDELDISSFDTSNVTDMWGMFKGLKTKKLDLRHFDTSNVTDMNTMFYYSDIDELDISNFDTSSVTDMAGMFKGIKKDSLDLSHFDTSNVTQMSTMFEDAKISILNIKNFDTSNVTNVDRMFANSRIPTLDLSSFDLSSISKKADMFRGANGVLNAYARTQSDADILNLSTNKPSDFNFVSVDSVINLDVKNNSSDLVTILVPEQVVAGVTKIKLLPKKEIKTVTSFKLNGELKIGDNFVAPSASETVTISDVELIELAIIETGHYYPSDGGNFPIEDEVIFEGAKSLNVELTYQKYGFEDSWGDCYIHIYDQDNNLVNNQKYSSPTLKTENIIVSGNTVKIKTKIDYYDRTKNYYGYKAVITPNY